MEKVINEQVKKALELLKTWAEQNNVSYFNVSYFDKYKEAYMTYTISGESELNEDGSINHDYYKHF